MKVYNHIVYNPNLVSIEQVINRLGGCPLWSISKIVPINQYESVAVFESEKEEIEKTLKEIIELIKQDIEWHKTAERTMPDDWGD